MIGEEDAASALDAIERTRQRAFERRNYAHGGDIVAAWGLVWLVANLATYISPAYGVAWPVGIACASVFSALRGRRRGGNTRRLEWQAFASVATVIALVGLVSMIAGVDNAAQANALISAFVAATYILQGIWAGHRYIWIGLAISGFVVAGWFLDRAHLELWLGIGGGGALILTGLWLRRA